MADNRPDLAKAADSALDWIESVAVAAPGGLAWVRDGDLADNLYYGTAGVLLGCAEIQTAGGTATRVAAGARDRLIHLAQRGESPTLTNDGLYTGWAGIATALRAWGAAADDAEAVDAATSVTAGIGARALDEADPSALTDIIAGDAGILLTLLDDDSEIARQAAVIVAERLAQRAEPATEGLHWRMIADYPFLMPGFSHGTAGVAYALASAGHRLRRPDLVDVAVKGAESLLAIGLSPSGWAIPHTIPPIPELPPVSFGWCHGPTGVVQLFLLLDEIDAQPRWQQSVSACIQALRDSRLPARLYPGYWDNLGRCCGTAGVGQFLLDHYRATGDVSLLDWSCVLAADVMARTVHTQTGVTWSNTEHTATPPDLPPEPGYMQGAAGIAGWLAQLSTSGP